MIRHEERRLIACLFIDVVGSTELTMRVGPERMKSALGAAFDQIRQLIEREGGTVEKYIGDEIYALFGAPVAHDDDPARALRAADAARRWASAQRDPTMPFDIRVGIETGEAIVDLAATEGSRQQMSVGAVVNIASRLCHQADSGHVLVGPLAHEATAEFADFRELGPVDLKGIGLTNIWALEAIKAEAPRRRLPFVGRASEIELLLVAHRRARSRSVLALVSGPPGQGKTRLVEEFIASLAGTRVLAARCRPGGEIGALAPLQDILLGADRDRSLDELVAEGVDEAGARTRIGDALAHSAGLGISDALASLGKDERDDEIQNAWRRLVAGLAGTRPLVIWVEDVHWAARDVVRLLDRLSLSGEPFLLIFTARPEFAEAAGLRPSGDRFFIELEGLELSSARALAASAGRSDDPVIARAEGNPLFIVELARTHESAVVLPLTLQGALGARLDELDPDDRSLLAHAAIVGETFASSDAAALADQEPALVARRLARLADRHYVDPVDGRRYRFYHSLLRDVAYGRLLVGDRMRLHARYARERASPEDPEVQAHHWWAALGAPDAEWVWRDDPEHAAMRRAAFAAHLEAGRRSAELFALDRAVPLFVRAFAFAADGRQRGEAKLALAGAYAHDLRGDDAWRAYMDAREEFVRDGPVPPELYLGALKVRMRVGAFKTPPARADVDAVYREAEGAARASGDAAVLARTLVYGAFTDMDPATLAGDRGKILEALRLSEGTDPPTRREILGWYAGDLLREFDLDRAVAVLDEIDKLPVETNELDRMEHLRGRALLAYRRGDLAGLEKASQQLVLMSRRMGPHLRSHADVYAAQTAVARGDWMTVARLGAEMDRTMRSSPQTAFCSSAGVILAYGAVAHARAGRFDEARALADRIRSTTSEQQGIRDLVAFALVFTGATTDGELPAGPTGAVTALAARAYDRALGIAEELDALAGRGAHFWSALAEAIREEVAHDRGGAPPRHGRLREIGYIGWGELVGARA